MEPIINAHAPEFTVQAFQNGELSRANGLFSSSIQLTSPSFVLQNWKILQTNTSS
mgnify:CR=1 FL=1